MHGRPRLSQFRLVIIMIMRIIFTESNFPEGINSREEERERWRLTQPLIGMDVELNGSN